MCWNSLRIRAATKELGTYALLYHTYEATYLELVLHVTADGNSTLFLGPALDDGYEITLSSA